VGEWGWVQGVKARINGHKYHNSPIVAKKKLHELLVNDGSKIGN